MNYVCFGKLAERVAQWAQKGTLASFAGKLDISQYNDKNGTARQWIEIVCDDVELLAAYKTNNDINQSTKVSPRASGPTNAPEWNDSSLDNVDLGRPF